MTRRNPTLYRKDWLAQRLASGSSIRAISREVGCTPQTVRTAARNLALPTPGAPAKVDQLRDHTWLQAQLEAGRTQRAIAAELGCSKTTVSKIVTATFGDRYRPDRPELYDRTWLQAQLDAGKSQRQMADDAGCTPKAIRDALDRFGLRARSQA